MRLPGFTHTALLAASIASVQAYDFRLLYTLPADMDMVTFIVHFGNTCAKWAPAVAAGLTFQGFNVQPGDYHGLHTDTQAKIYCVWNVGGDPHQPETFTEDVAASLNATRTPAP